MAKAKTEEVADPRDKIIISHPEIDSEGVCTRRQFERVWEPRGWTQVQVDPDEMEARVDAVATGIGATESNVDAVVTEN